MTNSLVDNLTQNQKLKPRTRRTHTLEDMIMVETLDSVREDEIETISEETHESLLDDFPR